MATNPLAGQQDLASTPADRVILFSKELLAYGKGVIDPTVIWDGGQAAGFEYSLQPGTIMARITATKLWVPCLRTTVTAGGGATSAAVPVVDARLFKAGEKITVGADAVTILSINYATNVITLTASITFANSEAVVGTHAPDGVTAVAGAEIPRAILDEYVDAYDKDLRTAVKVTTGKLLFSGCVKRAMILGDIAAALAATNYLTNVIFDDQVGQD